MSPATPDITGTTSASNSGWNHFGRIGLVAGLDQGGDNLGDTMSSYPFAFSLALSYDDTAEKVSATPSRRLFFPVNPEAIGLPIARVMSGVDVLSANQNTQVGNVQLRTITFESFFPMAYDGDYCNPVPVPGLEGLQPRLDRTPRDSVAFIEGSMASTNPVYLHFIAGATPDTAVALPPPLPCFVSAFESRYQAGHPLDIFFSIELTEYRPPVVGTRVSATGRPKPLTEKIKRAGGVTTNKGKYSTLHGIARDVYGPKFGIGWRQLLVDTRGAGAPLLTTKNKKVTGPSQKLNPGQRVIVTEFRGVGI